MRKDKVRNADGWPVLTQAQYDRMLDYQGFGCAVCGELGAPVRPGQPAQRSGLVIDHDHTTGFVRGLLCDDCNRFEPFSKSAAFANYRANPPAKKLRITAAYYGIYEWSNGEEVACSKVLTTAASLETTKREWIQTRTSWQQATKTRRKRAEAARRATHDLFDHPF